MSAQPVSFHEDLGRHHEVAQASDRSVGLVIGTLLLAIAGFRGVALENLSLLTWLLAAAGAALLGLALAAPRYLGPLSALWLKIGYLLSRIVNPIVLGFLFYGVFTPTGIFMRWRGNDLLSLKLDPKASNYWIERRPPGPPPEKMRHQY